MEHKELDNICVSSEFYTDSRDNLKQGLQQGLDLTAKFPYIVVREMRDYLSQTEEDSKKIENLENESNENL